eukprot:TRINITY_DN22073_c0_g1_i1.p1 TRINITY_DN22073_c0_g1~~TRINITY_DN22073_c0_g1_i1.p1  ORF type:complete len:391 (-),score=89.21 TRINITY_DN22073_c0_g1_i1:33-1205(-)
MKKASIIIGLVIMTCIFFLTVIYTLGDRESYNINSPHMINNINRHNIQSSVKIKNPNICESGEFLSWTGPCPHPITYSAPNSKFAYSTFITDDSWIPGFIAAKQSLSLLNSNSSSKVSFVALIPKPLNSTQKSQFSIKSSKPIGISPICKLALNCAGIQTQEVDIIPRPSIHPPHRRRMQKLKVVFTKLHVWNLIQYKKILFIDSDILFLHDATTELLLNSSIKELSAARDCCYKRDTVNSGLFVLKPNTETFNDLMEKMNSGEIRSADEGDQGIIDAYWKRKGTWKKLEDEWNTQKWWGGPGERGKELRKRIDRELEEGKIKAVHYFRTKPWFCGDKEKDCNGNEKARHNGLHKIWWWVWDTLGDKDGKWVFHPPSSSPSPTFSPSLAV